LLYPESPLFAEKSRIIIMDFGALKMRNLIKDLFFPGLMLVTPALVWAQSQGADRPSGQQLFEKHGCTNCHGSEGIHPTSKYAPVLKGKPADYLYRNALAIFGGDTKSSKTRFMHDQFCIGEEQEEGCYPPPLAADLRVIADWLGADAAIPSKKTTPQALYVTATEANEKLNELGDSALFVDVRTRAEVVFIGMPSNADANIPYLTTGGFEEWNDNKHTFKLIPNSAFVMRINELVTRKGLTKESPIFLICRSGSRSAKAAKLLDAVGYKNVYSVTDGFEGDKAKSGPRKGERVVNGWRNAGLPWSYRLEREKMYFDF
jgi:rhodanese-related sulfurtransferase